MLHQILRFGSVGLLATGVHTGIAFGAVHLGISVLVANTVGFAAAFVVGFLGHHCFTFRSATTAAAQRLRRYCLLSLTSFVAGQTCLAFLTSWAGITDTAALLITFALIAGSNFLLARHWAFAHV
ncbi:MAG: GtrA family protein [Rhodobacteraceae bacterium]|nr:GtrA family protein [Paracoccaceae bacterium]